MTALSLKIGTRASKLALWQAGRVAHLLKSAWPRLQIEIKPIKTTGDLILDRPLTEIGGKGLFVKEIEEALLSGAVDLAVHSVKDMPGILPEPLTLAAVLPREEYRDALISRDNLPWNALPTGARIGSTSARRSVQGLRSRGDVVFLPCRGNVDTRLQKLDSGEYDAIILSAAGLHRLGFEARIAQYLDWIPAVGQGVMGVEIRRDRKDLLPILIPLNCPQTAACTAAERAFLKTLQGNCEIPLGALASEADGKLRLQGFWVDPNRGEYRAGEEGGATEEAEALGTALARRLALFENGAQL